MIDWFTVIAQIVNFLILVALLRYFLYGRILAAINKREQEIHSRWDEADRQKDEAAQELEAARDTNRQLGSQREELLAKVRDDVEVYRQQLTASVRSEIDELQSRWSTAIQEETESFLRDLRRRTSEEVCAIARHALSDLAGAKLEREMVERFLQNVKALGERERQAVLASLDEGNRVVVLQTTSELPEDMKKTITRELRQQFLDDLEVHFEQSDDLLCGIAMRTDAHTMAWNLRDFFASLEQELKTTIEEEVASRSQRKKEAAEAAR